jgi:uncharacterized protein (DUF433 family)
MSAIAVNPHVRHTSDGTAWIDETNVKVIEVVSDWLAHSSSPEEMHFQYPHLSLAQIHSALAFYYDNRGEIDAEIARRTEAVEALRARAGEEPTRQNLLARLHVPVGRCIEDLALLALAEEPENMRGRVVFLPLR